MQTIDQEAPPAPIDPRIRQRRIAVKRSEGRRRLRLLTAAGGLVALLLLGWGATRSALLDVDHIRVSGAMQTPAADVAKASGITRGHAMTGIVEGAAARRVRSLPWVATARVRRAWPGTLRIRITERKPVAAVRARTGGWMLVDASGRLLGTSADPPPELVAIEVTGPAPAGEPGQQLDDAARGALVVARAIPRDRVTQLRVVAAGADGMLELRIVPGGVVRFGPPTDVEAKVLAALTVLDRVDLRNLREIDVRVPGAPVLTRTAPIT